MIDLYNFQSISLSQLFASVKFHSGSGSGYHLVTNFFIVMFHMIMTLMKYSFIPQTFFRIFFFRIRNNFTMQFLLCRISLCNSFVEVILHILKISTKLGVTPQGFCENQNSIQDQVRIYFGFQ